MFGTVSLTLAALSVLTAANPVGKRSISAPIMNSDFPDPAWIQVGNNYYAFSTTSGGLNVPVATSPDFVTWTRTNGYDALPVVGKWSTGNAVWAPDVVQLVRCCRCPLDKHNADL